MTSLKRTSPDVPASGRNQRPAQDCKHSLEPTQANPTHTLITHTCPLCGHTTAEVIA